MLERRYMNVLSLFCCFWLLLSFVCFCFVAVFLSFIGWEIGFSIISAVYVHHRMIGKTQIKDLTFSFSFLFSGQIVACHVSKVILRTICK